MKRMKYWADWTVEYNLFLFLQGLVGNDSIQVQRLFTSSFQEYLGASASLVTLIDGILDLLKFVGAPCADILHRGCSCV